MTYQCVANEVIKTFIANNYTIIIAMNKQFLDDYLLKSPSNGKGIHLAGLLLEVIMDKFNALSSLNCHNFVSGSEHFVGSRMDMIHSIMILRDHSGFNYVYSSIFLGRFQVEIIVFKMLVDLPWSGVNCVKCMQVGRDMKNYWVLFDHIKCLKDWTTLAYHMYDSKYCKVPTIVFCGI